MLDLTTPEGVVALMKGATSEQDWNDRCDEVKAANNGYPDFWFASVMLSGLAEETQANW